MEMVLLGFLMIRDLTLYEMKKAMENSIQFFYSASFGSLHPALKRLEKNEFVTSHEDSGTGRRKKHYSITEKGKQEHLNWLKSDIGMGRYQDEALLRLFFIHPLPEKHQAAVLEKYVAALEKNLKELEGILKKSASVPLSKENAKGYRFRMMAGEYGMSHMKLEIKFYNNIIKKIQTGEFK